MTTRRAVLGVLGTSAVIVAAGGVGLSQCDPMPEAAIEAWRGPAPSVRDPRVRALSYALLAPNPHNMQPWIVDLREQDAVTLICDRTRLLPETDPHSRQIIIGCGAFIELWRMAAAEQGFRADSVGGPGLGSPPLSDAPLCRLPIVADGTVARDPLFAQVLKRRTNRNAYDETPVSEAQALQIGAEITKFPVKFGWTSDPAQLARLRDVAKRAWVVEMTKDSTYRESAKVFRITGEEILKHRDGLSFHGPFFWWANALGLFTQQGAMRGEAFIRQQSIDLIDGPLKATPAFGWIATAQNHRIAQLASGAAYVRANLKATELGLAMQPLSQALQEFPEMLPLRAEIKQLLGLAESDTVQMFFRIGRAAAVEPSPRRRLDDIVKA